MVKISKTYTPKETEKYMCAKHLAYFKLKLNEWKKSNHRIILTTARSKKNDIIKKVKSSNC